MTCYFAAHLQVNFQGQRQPFADGGGTDNLAVTPLLRRRVKTIVACVSNNAAVMPDTTADTWAANQVGVLRNCVSMQMCCQCMM
jgi:hypothetical protein